MLSARELYDRGVAASSSGRLGAARRYLNRAAGASTDADLSALVEVSTAYLDSETGDLPGALARLDDVLARPGLEVRTLGIARSQRGLLHARAGSSASALRDFTDALGVIGDDAVLAGRAYLNRGNLHMQNGDLAGARADFEAVLGCLESPEPDANYDKAKFNLGYADQLAGDLVSAMRRIDDVEPRLAALGPLYQATISGTRGEILIQAGLLAQGEKQLANAAQTYGRRRLPLFQGEAEVIRARALLADDPRAARRIARQAARRFRRHGSEVWALRADAIATMAAVRAGSRSLRLVEEIDALLPRLHRERLMDDAALVHLHAVRVLIRRGDLDDAGRRLRKVRVSASAPIGLRLLRLEIAADLERARGRRSLAFGRLRQGLESLHAWQSSFGSLDLQSGVVGHGRQLVIDGLALAVADGRPEVLFEWSERARGLASRVIPVRSPGDPAVTEELSEVRWLAAQAPAADSPAGRRLAELRDSIRQHAWYGDGSREVVHPVSLTGVTEVLEGRDSGLVAYVTTRERIVALVVAAGLARVVDLGSRGHLDTLLGGLFPDLDMAGSDLPAPFGATVRGELVSRLADLAEVLVTPLLDDIGDRSLVLTPSGVLAGVPWGLLPGFHGRPVTVAQSATSWLARSVDPLRLESAGFVAGPRVERAEAEVAAAAGLWAGSSVLGVSDATAGAVSALAAGVDVLHVSAHGRHSAENPLFSGVELVDGPWFGYDIDQLAAVPRLVLLSACEVGRSEVRYGEELVGMTAAWQHAGVRSVVASAAAVNDGVAHDVLVGVHRGLRAGLDPAAALAAALPAPTPDTPPAPFVCFG
ncbi:MAG: CHAT domain-containing protein [Nocardioides sp.]|uniref:CHAT domain-containing protein n=1 Tax=Nocardioides sp. TaxID=35761 RepID=UPI0039E235AF